MQLRLSKSFQHCHERIYHLCEKLFILTGRLFATHSVLVAQILCSVLADLNWGVNSMFVGAGGLIKLSRVCPDSFILNLALLRK